jgi:hypothetical protein
MLSLKRYLKSRNLPCGIKSPKKTLQEGFEMTSADLIKELRAMKAQSIFAKLIVESAGEATLHLKVKKWSGANSKSGA